MGKISINNKSGVTMIELLVVIALISILAIVIAPEIGRFNADKQVRNCATDLIQYMRTARAMAIKENREYLAVFDTANQRYLIGFDQDGDDDLITVSTVDNGDTYGPCKDTNDDRLPDADTDDNGDGVPDCVKFINLGDCGNNVIYGYSEGIKPPVGPAGSAIPDSGVNFSGTPPTAQFDSDGSTDKLGSVYFQQTSRGYSYCVRVSNIAGAINMWKWDGDEDNTSETDWTEIR